MGKAKWWVCESCTSLNDLPANKCYKCRVAKPGNPKLIDDQYSQVGGAEQRVGITVDLSKVGDLTRPDPTETAEGGSILEAFEKGDDIYGDLDTERAQTPRYDPYTGAFESTVTSTSSAPRPMREPAKRGIDAIGGRHWTEESQPAPASEGEAAAQPSPTPEVEPAIQAAPLPPLPPPPPGAVPPPPGAVPPPPGAVPPPPGTVPPPRAAAPPPPGTIPPPRAAGPPPPGAQPPLDAPPRPMAPPPSPPPGAPRPPGAPPLPPPPGRQGRPPMPPPPPGTPLPPPPPPREASQDD